MDRDGHTRRWLRTPIKSGQVGHQLSINPLLPSPKPPGPSVRVHLTAALHLTDDIATPSKSSALIDLASLRKTSSEHAPEEDASVGEEVLYATRVRVRSGHAQL